LLNPAAWPEYVTISDWYFKPPINAPSVGASSTPDAVVKRVKVDDQQCEAVASVNDSNDEHIGGDAEVAHDEIHAEVYVETLHDNASTADICNDDTILDPACAMDIQHDGE